MAKKKTHEVFVQEVFDLVAAEYSVIGLYTGTNVKIKLQHNECGYNFEMIPKAFLRGQRCPKCARERVTRNNRRTHEQYLKEVETRVGFEYVVLGQYVNGISKIKMKHVQCNHEYEVMPKNFLRGDRCPNCFGTPKKSQQQFLEEVNTITDDYEVLTPYKGNKIKVKFKHKICGCEFETMPIHFLRGSGCPRCAGNMQKTHAQFETEVFDLVGDKYLVLSKYKNWMTKVKMQHNECGNVYEVTPNSFLRGSRCPVCMLRKQGESRRKTHNEFLREVQELYGKEYTVLSEYITAVVKVAVQHNKCGNIYNENPSAFLGGKGCPICSLTNRIEKLTKTHETFVQEVFDRVGYEYTVLGHYINTDTHIQMRHNTCQYEYLVTPDKFLSGTRCPDCYGNQKKTTQQFIKEVYNLVGDNYSIIGEYINSATKICLKHNECGYEYMVAPSSFLAGTRCPACNESHGERAIRDYLIDHDISFISQYTIEDCKDIRVLKFDFAVFHEDGSLYCLIEYDGGQHFYPVKYFGGEKGFQATKRRDEIKNKYCNANGIKLFRIPYFEENIMKVLDAYVLDNFERSTT
ncbi:hypothetical protein V7183_09625 [Bacillus sp. JJ1127]|uniref:DUF2726 domain-containing protein n=1 Tax=Bacillus sp. JJ1127 TaxID=3122952 RepID=UPI002FFE5291